MNSNRDRLLSLNNAASLYVLRRSLGSAGWSSICWALVWFVFAIASCYGGGISVATLVFVGVAVLLLSEGVYVLRARSKKALTCEAISLAVIACLNLSSFAYSWYQHSQGLESGKPANPIFGLIMAFNAWQTWSARRCYEAFSSGASGEDVIEVEEVLAFVLKADAGAHPEIVKLKQTGFTTQDSEWRLLFCRNLVYVVNVHTLLGRRRPTQVIVCDRDSFSYEVTGDAFIGRARKVRLLIDGDEVQAKYEITPEMLDNLQTLTYSSRQTV